MSKLAFVLSGGGAKGAFQVGVMKQLIGIQGMRPSRIYGTSTGALQASGYAHLGIKRLEEEWLKIQCKSDVMSYNWWPHLFTLGLTLDGIYHMGPLRKKLEAIAAQPKEPGLNCDAIVTRVSLLTGKLEYVNYDADTFVEAVLASCSVPILNPPVNGYVDGGVRDQTPIAGAIKDGYDEIVCVITNPLYRQIPSWSKPKFLPIPKILIRVADEILAFETWLDEIKQIKEYKKQGVKITVYAPDKLLLDTQDYDAVKIRAAIEQGFFAKPIEDIGEL